jgi:hypothetical protein
MKKLTFMLFLAVILASCGIYYQEDIYKVRLREVEQPENVKEQYSKSKITILAEENETKNSYEDDFIKIIWLPALTEFSFTLENKSDNSIKIIWDEAVYIDEDNSSLKVMHSGVKYIDGEKAQPLTVIAKKTKINDLVTPVDNIYYSNPSKYFSGGWRKLPLFSVQKSAGKTVKILLPIQIQETINEYIFSFKINHTRINTADNKVKEQQ